MIPNKCRNVAKVVSKCYNYNKYKKGSEIEMENKKEVAVNNVTIIDIALKLMCNIATCVLKFSYYLFSICFQMLIDLLQKLIDYLDNLILADWSWYKNRVDYLEEGPQLKIEVSERDNVFSHNYKIQRSKRFNMIYNQIGDTLNVTKYKDITLNEEMAEDILKKIDALNVECEKIALKEGFAFAKTIKSNEEINKDNMYNSYIKYKVMKGD